MPIKTLAPWFGGKRRLAPLIVELLGPHDSYFEPFCGGVSVLMVKPRAKLEIINDLHGDIVNLARVVAHPVHGPKFYRWVRRLILSDAELRRADELLSLPAPVAADITTDPGRARAFFVACWMGRNGEVGLRGSNRESTLCVRWTHNGGDPSVRWRNAVSSIPAWRKRLARVTVLNRDGFGVLGKVPDEEGVAVYCDPPYLVKSDEYAHDFENNGGEGLMPDDHRCLAEAVGRFRRARVVVSYYAHPRLDELYPRDRWRRVEVEVNKSQGNASRKVSKAVEVLLVNDGEVRP